MDIIINPKSIHPTLTYDKLRLVNMSVIPFSTATMYLQLHFTDDSGTLSEDQCVLNKVIEMTSEEYADWTTDEYLVQLILTKLNLTNSSTLVPKLDPDIKTAINKLRLK